MGKHVWCALSGKPRMLVQGCAEKRPCGKKTLWKKGLVEKRPCGKKAWSYFENWKKGLVKIVFHLIVVDRKIKSTQIGPICTNEIKKSTI